MRTFVFTCTISHNRMGHISHAHYNMKMIVDEGDAAAPILLDNPEVVLDDVDDILTEEGLVECLDLGEVSEDEV